MAVTEYDSRRVKRRPTWRLIALAAAVLIIIFAFIWEAVMNRPADSQLPEYNPLYPLNALSQVQEELSQQDWITSAFLPVNEFSRPGDRLNEINAIVIHYVGNPGTTAKQNRNYFAGLKTSGEAYLSSNFIIGLDGEILQCVPVDEIAYASNTRNGDTLSIECCHPDDSGEFTQETYDSAVALTAWLCEKFSLTSEDVIRHYDITGKECPRFFVENADLWKVFKNDVDLALQDLG